jgi:outer membrane protein OmpA-like peptidoglycan-associated protein
MAFMLAAWVWASALPAAAASQSPIEGCRAKPGRGDAERARSLYTEAIETMDPGRRIGLFTQSLAEQPTWEASYHLGAALEKTGRDREARSCFMWAFGLTDLPQQKAQAAARVAMTYALENCAAERVKWLKESLKVHRFPTVEKALRDALAPQRDRILSAAVIATSLAACDPADADARSFGVEASIDIRIHFAYDRAELTEAGRQQARELGRALAADAFRDSEFELIGHTDARGDDAYNLTLSKSRAEAVRQFLAAEFPNLKSRIQTNGRGKRELLMAGTTEQDHALNRRVEVVVQER